MYAHFSKFNMRHNTLFLFLLVLGVANAESSFLPIDLTWDFDENTEHWPTTKSFEFTKKVAENKNTKNWYALNEFCIGEHVGTHIDAPYHFNEHGWKLGDIPFTRLITDGVSINVPKITNVEGEIILLTVEHIKKWESINGKIPTNSVVLVNFGWWRNYGSKIYIHNKNNDLIFPAITKAAAELLVERQIYGVGLDTPSVDQGVEPGYESHRVFAENNVYILENVKFPLNFQEKDFRLFVMPMKIREGTGGPLRLVAVPN